MPLLALFIIVPIIEIALFIQVGGSIGLWPTLAIVIVTAMAGTYLVKRQGLAELARIQNSLNTLDNPTRPLAHGAMILASGLLLLTPGFFTDAVGFLLLVPGIRDKVMQAVQSRINVQSFTVGQQPGGPRPTHGTPPADDVVDAEYVEVTPRDGPSGWTKK